MREVEIRSADRIDSVTFITNKGIESSQFGGNGGRYIMLTIAEGFMRVGFYGEKVPKRGKNGLKTVEN